MENAESSDMTGRIDDVTVPMMSTDGINAAGETSYQNNDWSKWWGYFNAIADLQSALLMKSIWNVGKGWTADNATTASLDNMRGWGKDTFDDIIFNMDVIRNVGGDSYAEIVRNPNGTLVNLKPLDPSSIKIIVDDKGIIKRYEQTAKIAGKTSKIFKTTDIFHLTCNRLADQIHGISRIAAVEDVILANNENFVDLKKLMHHQVKPFILWKLKTDDPVKIQEVVKKIDDARNLGEDMFIPDDDDAISYEIVQVNISDAVFSWRTDIRNQFYRTFGLPLIIFGSGGSTESGGKIEYLAHEQVFSADQRFLEQQIWNQLAIKVKFTPPVTLLENLQTDEAKDANQGLEIQPNDVTSPAPAQAPPAGVNNGI